MKDPFPFFSYSAETCEVLYISIVEIIYVSYGYILVRQQYQKPRQ